MVRLAFYKGEGDIVDKAIRWWTKSEFSHVEMVFGDEWCSTSPRTMKVGCRKVAAKPENWTFVQVVCTPEQEEVLKNRFRSEYGKKYDWLGIVLTQIVPLSVDAPNRWFCSEICAQALIDAGLLHTELDANEYDPGELYSVVRGES